MPRLLTRRSILTGIGLGSSSLALAGCDRLSQSPAFADYILHAGEWLSYNVHRLIGPNSLAREYAASEMSPVFRTNGNTMPASPDYRRLAAADFAGWRLAIDGLVTSPKSYSLAELRALPSRTQITRHDCVEGWSAIGKWTGVPMAHLINEVKLLPKARFLVLHCADDFDGANYYESIDLVDGFHPQTILAYAMNDQALPVGHGAPLRLRVERQLGYKHAKYVMRVEAVARLSGIGQGKGGFWEDAVDYDWYAGV